MRYRFVFLVPFVAIASLVADADVPLRNSGVPVGVAATLYADGPFVDVLEVAAEGPWLYAAIRDGEGAQYIDVWRVELPAPPVRVDTLDYPDLQTDAFAFVPLAIVPRNGVVLIQAEGVLRSYRHGEDGKLVFVSESKPVSGLGPDLMHQLSVGGAFASHTQQVVPPSEFGTVPLDAINQQVILSLRDPEQPFLVRAASGTDYKTYLDTAAPVNAEWRGMPASISVDAGANEVVLTAFSRTVETHLHGFWDSKLDVLFAEGALDATLQAHVRAAVASLDLPALRGELIDGYSAALDMDAQTIEGLIRDQHDSSDPLSLVLTAHGLSLDESLALSLRKLAMEGLDDTLRAELGRILFRPALEAWLDETLGITWQGLSSAEIAGEIAFAFDAEIDAEGAVRYLTLELVAPLLNDPDFMTWTLQDLIDALADGEVGATIDTVLTVTGVGLIAEVLAAIDDLPGFALPNCALFPGTTRGLLEIALFSGGAGLDVDGLAWFEMLKLYQYLTGGVDFTTYVDDVEVALQDLHFDLAGEFTDKYLGFFAGIEGFALSEDALDDIAAYAAIDQALGEVLARAAMERLALAGHATDVTLREFLQGFDLSFDINGDPVGDVDEFLAALTLDGLDLETVGDLFFDASVLPLQIGGHVEAYLIGHLQALYGFTAPDLSLRAALYLYLTEQFDLSTTMGAHLEGLLDGFVLEVHAESLFGAYLTNVLNAFDGDCIAQWLLGLDVATGIATPLLLEAYPIAAKAALSGAYHAGIDAAISAMFSVIADVVAGDLSGHWASWTEQVTQTTYRSMVPEAAPGYDISLHGSFVWGDRVVLLLSSRSQAEPFALRPVELHTYQPDDVGGTRTVVDLGLWEQVDYVVQAGNALFVSGAHPVENGRALGLLIDLDRLDGRHFVGETFLPLAVTQQMAALDGGAVLALRGEGAVTLIPNANAQSAWRVAHAGDTDDDGLVSLSELLRVIQFYNSGGYHCGGATEDGFDPGSDGAAQNCVPHASDYNAQDWIINLSELLRFIQFYNAGGYASCVDGEDGFCPAAG